MNTLLTQLYSPSLDVIMLVIAVVADIFLAVVVYLSNPRSATNKIFSLLTIFTMFWLIMTYVPRLPEFIPISLVLHRLGIFFAAAMSALFFLLAHTMPAEQIQLKKSTYIATVVSTLVMMLINISPYAFVSISIVNGMSEPQPGPGLIPFAILSTLFSILTIYWLVRKYRRSSGDVKSQFGLVLSGICVMLVLIIATILIPVVFFGSVRFLAFTPLYALVFLGMTAYAITKYELFNIKVLLTQALTILLCLVLFARLFGEAGLDAQIIDGLVLVTMAIFGFFLVQSVKREVEQREKIQKLAEELQEIDDRQETLIHFIGHEVKGYLTKSSNTFASLSENDFGPLPEALKPWVDRALADSRQGVASVESILKAANLKKGTVSYIKAPFDLKALVADAVEKAKQAATDKKLELTFTAADGSYEMNGDKLQIEEHVLRNLIDNSINYTPSGSVAISLKREGNKLVFAVKDTGIGITDEDKKRLFTEGGHGADSIKVNAHSTGYGLYIAKQITEAHGGTIRAKSEGAGKGSTFIAEFPVI